MQDLYMVPYFLTHAQAHSCTTLLPHRQMHMHMCARAYLLGVVRPSFLAPDRCIRMYACPCHQLHAHVGAQALYRETRRADAAEERAQSADSRGALVRLRVNELSDATAAAAAAVAEEVGPRS